ncbi:hypothetical protein EGW08_003531 [Elysia chlorotica]|uniref:CUB domain-containing protein n=1 Tax=Elysia chlorotica TaxID=188477 RepID=A0A3S1ACY3_ELYCH|nr:hypothetical protein EGW08_003531 [Elysia chlorotica]
MFDCMYFALRVLVVACLVTCVQPEFRVYRDHQGSACVRVDAQFSISVTASKGNKLIGEKRLDNMTRFKFYSGSCDAAHAIVILNCTAGARTMFRFMFKTRGDAVVVIYSFSFFVLDLFPQLTPAVQDNRYKGYSSPGAQIGPVGTSYRCGRLQTIPLSNGDVPFETRRYNFSVTLSLRKIHAQAFNMSRGEFGPAVDCPAEAAGSPSVVAAVVVVLVLVVPIAVAMAATILVLYRHSGNILPRVTKVMTNIH